MYIHYVSQSFKNTIATVVADHGHCQMQQMRFRSSNMQPYWHLKQMPSFAYASHQRHYHMKLTLVSAAHEVH